MLPIQFFSQNAHFAINLFAALVFFAVFWLSFDAWLQKKDVREFVKWTGFLLVAVSFVISATVIEQSITGTSRFGEFAESLARIIRLIGFIGIILGQILDPLQEVPKLSGLEADSFEKPEPEAPNKPLEPITEPGGEPAALARHEVPEAATAQPLPDQTEPTPAVQHTAPDVVAVAASSAPAAHTLHHQPHHQPHHITVISDDSDDEADTANPAPIPKPRKKLKKMQALLPVGTASYTSFALPAGAFIISLLYLRRATTGLERHYKPVAMAFGLLTAAELLSLGRLWRDSANPLISQAVASFGPVWIAEQAFLLLAMLVLGRWVWSYLMQRFLSQLFIILTSLTLMIFLLITISFTFLLVQNVQKTSLDNLQTAASVLNYAIDSKKSETLANTQAIAENPNIAQLVSAADTKGLDKHTETFLQEKKLTSLVITNDSGQVLLRAEDPSRTGDSISSDTMVRRALIGQSNSSVSARQGVLAPVVSIKSAVPIRNGSGQIIGSAVVGLVADNAFIDGIKRETGLDSAVYAGDVRSATTFVAPDGKSRWVGVKEHNGAVQSTVLKAGKTFKGTVEIQNRHFLAVYTPLKDVDGTIIGMLFIGQPQVAILEAAAHSVELTFIITAILLLLAIIPAYLISKYLDYQLE